MSTPTSPAAVSVSLHAHDDAVGVDVVDLPPRRACTAVPESTATVRSMPVPTSGFSGTQAGHRLALHVGAHQRAVGVVVLEERDQRRRHRHDLRRRHVHVLDLVGASTA